MKQLLKSLKAVINQVEGGSQLQEDLIKIGNLLPKYMEIEDLFKRYDIKKPWDFVSAFYNNYDHCTSVTESNDLQVIVDGEDEEDSDARNILKLRYGGDRLNPKIQEDLDAVDGDLYRRAIEDFIQRIHKKTPTLVKIILSDDDRLEYKVYHSCVDGEIYGVSLMYGTQSECVNYCNQNDFKIVNADELIHHAGDAMKNVVRNDLINILSAIPIDTPRNIDEIVDFVYDDVLNTADIDNWSDGDVAIGFRKWMEKDCE